MCGRYTIRDPKALAEMIARITGVVEEIVARYNVAPSQKLKNPVVKLTDGKPHLAGMSWGLRPFWDKDEKPRFTPPINARSEEMFGKPTFRHAVQEGRCLVPADGFYEWQRPDKSTKIPHYIVMKDGGPFFIAGLYEQATETRTDTYALLTGGPNEVMTGIHDRMPIILDEAGARRWIAPGARTREEIAALVEKFPAGRMRAFRVSDIVNNARNDVPECVQPAAQF